MTEISGVISGHEEGRKNCPCHKESLASQSVVERVFEQIEENQRSMNNGLVYKQTATEATMDEKNEIAKQQMARRSQSVEGWEKEFDKNISIGMPDGVQAEIKDFIRKVEKEAYWTGIKVMDEEADRAISTTLTTLVKEMEAMEVDLLEEGTTPERMWEFKGFNAGISAAQEVVKKMGINP